MSTKNFVIASALIVTGFGLAGCNKSTEKAAADGTATTKVSGTDDKHDSWWCSEHGVPEAECAQCNQKLAADFKAKGDWCKKHDRPESQCFICHPELEAKFAALYEAKFGTKPPKPGM
jgi:cobalt-zinc-cadmium efflux system membrane fusion protein